MKFGQTTIPNELFDQARARLRQEATCSTEAARSHLLKSAGPLLSSISPLETNQWIVANRVVRAVIDELRAAGEIEQIKRGVWAKSTFMAAAKQQEEAAQ